MEPLCGKLRAMQCTPKSNINPQSYKGQPYNEDCSDSGLLGWFQSPGSITGVALSDSLSPSELIETPKENLRLHVTPKEQSRESVKVLSKYTRDAASVVNWCETPKLNRRGFILCHKLLTCKPTVVKNDSTGSPITTNAEASLSRRSEHWLSESFDSLDVASGGATRSLNVGHDLAMSGRKQRLLFSQVRTSTCEDGKLNTCLLSSFDRSVSIIESDFRGNISSCQLDVDTPSHDSLFPLLTKENFPSPISSESILCDGTSVFNTSMNEDSGFSSLTLDKSQDSSDHDGSFQELLISASKGTGRTLTDVKRRSRLHRQHRLSTLKEGGSQSEEDQANRKHENPSKCSSHSTDDVFADATPCNPAHHSMTPLRTTPTAVMFRTSMPLAGLIGRKMGLRKLDILTELKKRNLRHILANMFSKCSLVCRSWNEIIEQDHQASLRRRIHLSELEDLQGETRSALPKRSALKKIQAQSRTSSSSYCTPPLANTLATPQHGTLSTGSSTKRDKFLEVAKTLFHDECLKPCPRCQHPARCHLVKGEGVCSRVDCGFQFCVSCLCAFHGSRECGSQSAGRRKKDNLLPGSALSKRNVRRL
uniref:F-box protein 43 n=1 Tax=Poecilia reticulata TaxID=8081 RepID=A0A3P9Q8X7_POERE